MSEWTNDDWLNQLAQEGTSKDAAVSELRQVIRRGLGKALRGHRNADDAFLDDTTQDAVMKVITNLAGFRGESKFTTWAIAVSVRVAFSELRKKRWKDVSLDGMTEAGMAPAPATESNGVQGQLERDELIVKMREVMNTQLTERQRFVILAELTGVAQAELCDRLGLNRNALYKLSHDARKKLKSGLLNSGITEDDVREAFAIAS